MKLKEQINNTNLQIKVKLAQECATNILSTFKAKRKINNFYHAGVIDGMEFVLTMLKSSASKEFKQLKSKWDASRDTECKCKSKL